MRNLFIRAFGLFSPWEWEKRFKAKCPRLHFVFVMLLWIVVIGMYWIIFQSA